LHLAIDHPNFESAPTLLDGRRPTTVLLGLLLCVSLCSAALGAREALAQELLQNGGFEDGAAPWSGCGGVSLVERQEPGTTAAMVRTGDSAARVGGITDGSCGSVPFSQFVLVQPVAIPADATEITLSFWFSRLGPELPPEGNTVADLGVSLSSDPSFGGALFDVVPHNVLRLDTVSRHHDPTTRQRCGVRTRTFASAAVHWRLRRVY
jgi:hypothetical protein